MSDFFTRLAERTLGLALIIQPIKPSLFAPELDAGGATPFEVTDESATAQTFSGTWQGVEIPAQARGVATSAAQSEHAQTEYSGPAATPARSSTGDIPVETPLNGAHSQGNLHQSELHNRRRASVAEYSGPTAARARLSTSNIPAETSMPGAHSQGNLHQSERHQRGPAQSTEPFSPNAGREFTPAVHTLVSAAQQSSPRAPSLALSLSYARGQGDNASERSTSSDTKLESAALVETSIMLHEQTMSRHVVLGKCTKRSSQSMTSIPTPQAQPEASTPEPAIQVTIGRVEVRAVTAPPTTTRSQPQSARPPAMSLDEYLRRQEQGGRR